MRKIKLPSGKTITCYEYYITNALVVKFIDTEFKAISDFFGEDIIPSIETYTEQDELVEQHSLFGGVKLRTTYSEQGKIIETERKLVAEAYDEKALVVVGTDADGKEVFEESVIHHEAEYQDISTEVPVNFQMAILEKPTIEEQTQAIQKYIGMVNPATLDLDGWKAYRQEQNKEALMKFLEESSVEYEKKKYGVTKEDQDEMALKYTQYTISKASGIEASLEWHAKKEKGVAFTEKQFSELSMLVNEFVSPYMKLMQERKEKIYACKSISEVQAVPIEYSAENEEAVV